MQRSYHNEVIEERNAHCIFDQGLYFTIQYLDKVTLDLSKGRFFT